MEIKINNVLYLAYMNSLAKQSESITRVLASDCRPYESKLSALEELADLYDELKLMMIEYGILLRKDEKRLRKVSSSLTIADAMAAGSFKE